MNTRAFWLQGQHCLLPLHRYPVHFWEHPQSSFQFYRRTKASNITWKWGCIWAGTDSNKVIVDSLMVTPDQDDMSCRWCQRSLWVCTMIILESQRLFNLLWQNNTTQSLHSRPAPGQALKKEEPRECTLMADREPISHVFTECLAHYKV